MRKSPHDTRSALAPKRCTERESFESLEERFAAGVTVAEVVTVLADLGEKVSEATFRKYVQLGLLPHSVRVRLQGSGRGSRGLYPATVFRGVCEIRRLMAAGLTIEEIQREHLAVRGEREHLEQQLGRLEAVLVKALSDQNLTQESDPLAHRALGEVRDMGTDLVRRIKSLEARLTARARMARAAV